MKSIPIVVIATTAVAVLITAIVFTVRFTVTDYFEKNNAAFLNEKLIEEFKNKKIKAIEYIAAIDENGNNIKIFLHPSEIDSQKDENLKKKEEGFSDHYLEELNVLNQALFALSGLACTPLASGEPSNCIASKKIPGYTAGDGKWVPEHCHCTMPQGKY